jgi:hypothetical protein
VRRLLLAQARSLWQDTKARRGDPAAWRAHRQRDIPGRRRSALPTRTASMASRPYGAGPRTIAEPTPRPTRLRLEDLRRATKVVAAAVYDVLCGR